MKKSLSVVLALVMAFSLVVLPAGVAQAAANLYEYHNTDDDGNGRFYSLGWLAQTFTAGSNHSVTSVKLKLSRGNSPGTITVSIRATDGVHPTGPDLTSGTTDGDTLTTSPAGGWREIALTSYNLTGGTKYAIVLRAPGGDGSNYVDWRYDSTGGYAGGNFEHSLNSGTTWMTYADFDFMFEVYGFPTSVGGIVYPVNKAGILAPWLSLALIFTAGGAILVMRRRKTIYS